MGPRRILLAEDDALVREGLRARLASAGYDVHTARSGTEALQRIVALKPDVLVLDINMPEMDGFGVLEALKEFHPGSDMQVLVLTARQTAEDVQKALALGARDYIVKAQAEATLLRRVERLLRPAA
ncbi:MAG: response regulator [Brevundimonas sp.]|nr:MAG: response regulator [Brevundimonas sp.]